MLAKSLGESHAGFPALFLRAPAKELRVIVHAQMSQQPLALALVAGEHIHLAVENVRSIDEQGRSNGAPQDIPPAHRGGVVEMRNETGGPGRRAHTGLVIRRQGPEAGRLRQMAGRLVVHHVVTG